MGGSLPFAFSFLRPRPRKAEPPTWPARLLAAASLRPALPASGCYHQPAPSRRRTCACVWRKTSDEEAGFLALSEAISVRSRKSVLDCIGGGLFVDLKPGAAAPPAPAGCLMVRAAAASPRADWRR